MACLRSTLGVVLCCLVPAAAACQAPASVKPKSAPGPYDVELDWGVKVPMRDGVRLNATVYRPRGVVTPMPALLTITPYVADNYHDRARYFASHGYAFAIVDSRGRGNSGGAFEPFAKEGRDGHDAVEWLARRDWCNGKVGMWGGSYAGFNQWATLKELPPHLATIVPSAAAHPGVDFPAPGGILHSYWIQWLTMVSGTTVNAKLFADDAFWIRRFRECQVNHVPFRDLDVLAGNPSRHFHTWLKHRTADAYWDAMVPAPEQYAKIDLPILSITGQYDDDQVGALEYYLRHGRYGSAKSFRRHFLLIGPWDHAGTRTPEPAVGGLSLGPPSMVDMNLLHKSWYDWTLKGGPRPPVLKSPVLYYVTGRERWQHAEGLGALGARPKRLYLSAPSGRADDVFHSGLLAASPPGKEPPDRYVYDPLDVRATELEKEKIENFVTDQRFAVNLFGSGLVYHGEPLERPMEITGRLKVSAWVAMDVPDTDFQATVYEVKADGTSVLLGQDQLRARYRESATKEKLVRPGEVNCYELKGFLFISRQLARGSRLRLVFGAANSIYLEKNYNSGKAQGTETRQDARTAHVCLYHDAEHASFLELPEVPSESATAATKQPAAP
jgi:putative CocE/NonD family hydrolase